MLQRPRPFFPRLDGDHELKPKWRMVKAGEALAKQSPPWLIMPSVIRGRYVSQPWVSRQLVITTATQAKRNNASKREQTQWAKKLRGYADYIQRDEAAQGRMFDQDGNILEGPLRDAVETWTDDRRFYRLSINPQHGNEMPDMIGYTREVMQEVERHLLTDAELRRGVQLEWVGAVHDNTGRLHSHVLLRARVEDQDLVMSLPFQTRGLRGIARDVASREHHLGLRSYQEMEQQPGKESRRIEKALDAEMAQDLAQDVTQSAKRGFDLALE